MSLYSRTPELIGSMSSMVPGTQSTMQIPRSHTYFTLGLHFVVDGVNLSLANLKNYIDKITLRVNGEPRYEIKGTQLATYYKQRNITVSADFVPILLAQPHMRTAAGEDVSGYGTLDVRSFELHVELKAGNHTIKKLDLYAIRGANAPLGPHYRLTPYTRSSVGAGELELNSFTRAGQRISGIFLDTDKIDGVTLKADDVIIHSSKRAVREGFLKAIAKRSEHSKTFIDLSSSNRLEDQFEVAGRDVRMTCDMTDAGSFEMLVESIENMVAA